jgi:hypothetical protein
MQLIRMAALATLGLVTFVGACSSSGTSFGSGVGISGGSASPPGSAGVFTGTGTECPSIAPSAGEPCASTGVCEYGGHPDPACNALARCYGNNWVVDPPLSCPDSCPFKFDERKPGETCGGPSTCTYLEATCGCAGAIADAWTIVTSASAADAGDDADIDGSTTDGGTSAPRDGHWQCVRPGNGCPARLPVAGAHCTKPMICDYGTCVFGVPLTMECNGYTWLTQSTQSCP